jgi:hypothetical protein
MTAYYDLGQYSRPVTTTSVDAQAWFNRSLVWCYTTRTDQVGSRNWYYPQDDLVAGRPADHLEAMRGLGLLTSVILLAGLAGCGSEPIGPNYAYAPPAYSYGTWLGANYCCGTLLVRPVHFHQHHGHGGHHGGHHH